MKYRNIPCFLTNLMYFEHKIGVIIIAKGLFNVL